MYALFAHVNDKFAQCAHKKARRITGLIGNEGGTMYPRRHIERASPEAGMIRYMIKGLVLWAIGDELRKREFWLREQCFSYALDAGVARLDAPLNCDGEVDRQARDVLPSAGLDLPR